MHWIDVRKTLQDCGCILEGEYFFALKSGGMVATKYVHIDRLLTFPIYLSAIAHMLMRERDNNFTVIAGPATGAIPLVYTAAEVVAHRYPNNGLRTVFTERANPEAKLEFRRNGFAEAVKGMRAIVVEDISSMGMSARETKDAIIRAGGTVVEYRIIWNRNPLLVNKSRMDAPVFSLIEEPIESFKPHDHPMWGKWPMISDIGHPENFPNYPGGYISLL